MKTIPLLALATLPCLAQDTIPRALEGLDLEALLNLGRAEAMYSGGMEFENSGVDFENSSAEIGAFFHKPVNLGGGVRYLTYGVYETHFLRPDAPGGRFPVEDEDLHEIALHFSLAYISSDTPWLAGVWVNPALATDFDHLDGDDIFLDAAAGVGYRFTDRLTAGLGAAALNITGDTEFYPVPGLAWSPTDRFSTLIYGDTVLCTYEVNPCWKLQFELRQNGGIWNIDNRGGSRNIDLDSYRTGLASYHELTDSLWLSFGGGITFANELNLTTADGSELARAALGDLDTGYYGFVALNLKTW